MKCLQFVFQHLLSTSPSPRFQVLLFVLIFASELQGFAQSVDDSRRLEQEQESVRDIEAFRKSNEENYRLGFIVRQIVHISHREELLRDLDIVGYQKDKLREISSLYTKELQKLMFQFAPTPTENGEPPVFDSKKVIEMEKLHFVLLKQAMADIESLFLPHQVARIKEVAEMELANLNSKFLGKLGVPFAMAESIGLTTQQSKELLAATEEANIKFKAEVEALHLRYFNGIVDGLTKEQKDALEKKIGKLSDRSFFN